MKSLKTRSAVPNMQRRVHRIVNKTVFAYKKYRAFWVTQGGIKPFYQSVGRPFGVGNFPKKYGRVGVVGGYVGGKRFKRLLSGWRQERFAVSDFANTQRGNDVAAFKYCVQGDIGHAVDLDGREEAFDHGFTPVVVEGPGTALAIYRALQSV